MCQRQILASIPSQLHHLLVRHAPHSPDSLETLKHHSFSRASCTGWHACMLCTAVCSGQAKRCSHCLCFPVLTTCISCTCTCSHRKHTLTPRVSFHRPHTMLQGCPPQTLSSKELRSWKKTRRSWCCRRGHTVRLPANSRWPSSWPMVWGRNVCVGTLRQRTNTNAPTHNLLSSNTTEPPTSHASPSPITCLG